MSTSDDGDNIAFKDEAGGPGDKLESPWYRKRFSPHPFSLLKRYSAPEGNSFHVVSLFPWTADSLEGLWDGDVQTTDGWRRMISEFSGTIAVGGTGKLYIFWILTGQRPFCFTMPLENLRKEQEDIRSVAWALIPTAPLEPLVVFTSSSVIYILNVKQRRIVGRLRGHGGQITSVAVHPRYPQLFCTTSRDFSARVYDLTFTPIQKPNNPHWPLNKAPSLAGAAHGLHMSESEGDGIGRCVFVLMGGRSGGHRAAVLGADFHPVLPLIATCGMDRVVKIWRIPQYSQDGDRIAREDKPLFSSSRVHAARVLSINWISHDVLLTHSAPAIMRRVPEDRDSELYFCDGTVALWRWIGLDRFFPPNQPLQQVLRGCASDYQESSSYKLLSTYSLPIITTEHVYFPLSPSVHVSLSHYHDPLILFTVPPPFPYDDDSEDVVEITKRMRLDDDVGDDKPNDLVDSVNKRGDHERPPFLPHTDLPRIRGWDIEAPNGRPGSVSSEGNDLEACVMGMGGRLIVGIGSRGTIWIWTNNEP